MSDTCIIPATGEKDTGKAIFELLHKVVKDKQDIGVHDRIKRNHQLRQGKHWKMDTGKVPLISANLIFNHMTKNVNLLTDNNPVFNVAKIGNVEDVDEDAYDKIQRLAEHWWNETEQQELFEDSVLEGEEYGITIEHMKFNRELEWGIGEVETIVVDPLYFGFYPTKLKSPRDIQKAEALFYYYPMSVREIKRRWPKTGAKVKPDEQLLAELADDRREINQKKDSESKTYGALITLASSIKQILSFKFDAQGDEEQTLTCECWVKDYSYVTNEDGSKEPKYPGFIRRVIACNGGAVVLADDPNPSINPTLEFEVARKSYLFDRFPFYARNSVRDNSSAWGNSDLEQLEQLNMEFNKSLSQLVITKDRKARSKIINPKTSGVAEEEFTNISGVIEPVNSVEAAAIRYLTFDGDTNDFHESLNLFKEIFYTIAGTFELEQANTPGKNVIAYKAIAALIEQASTMRKGKIRAYSAMIRERGRCYISLAQNWYDDEHWVTYQQDGQTQTQQITKKDLLTPAKLTVVTGSTLPVSRVQKREEAIALYQQGAIDQEALLTELDWTNRKDVLMRMRSGPFGLLNSRLGELRMPPELAQYITEIGLMDDKTFEKEMKAGELEPFDMIFQELMQQEMQQGQGEALPDPAEQLELGEKQSKIKETEAKVAKTQAEILLIQEKIKSEQVEQLVKMEGIKFDSAKIAIERQRTVNDLAKTMSNETTKSSGGKTAGYNERGLQSNNE